MSTLQVQTLQGPTSGADSNTVRVADGHNLHAKGHVVQCVETSDSDVAAGISTSSDSFVSTGITVSITPEFIGSKVCVDYTGSLASVQTNSTMAVTLFKDGTQVMGRSGLGFLISSDSYDNFAGVVGQYTFTTTSLTTITFTVYARRNGGNGVVYPVNGASSYRLSATEIAQ